MWRRALDAAVTEARHRTTSVTTTTFRRNYAAKPPKPKPTTAAKSQKKKWSSNKGGGPSSNNPQSATTEVVADLEGDKLRKKLLAEDAMKKSSLDVWGPNGGPLFTPISNISELTSDDACSYIRFDMEKLNGVLPEGLPVGMVKEFEDSMGCALLVRRSFLYLRDNFRRLVDPVTLGSKAPKAKKQIVLDGPRSCGKSIALAMLAHWARDEGWLVFYAPKGRDWTHGGYFYKNEETGFWDTPLQAENILKDFLKFNESRLQQLPCQVYDSIPLGEGVGVGFMEGADSMTMPEGSTLFDLVQTGITNNHAAVGVVVHLRKELSLVKDVPVLIAIDQYNSWFTFSEYNEILSHHSSRPVHARELATINAFRPMKHDDMMVGAFSHSNAVGKLRQDLPGVPDGARVNFPRYSLDEAAAVCHYYLRQRLIRQEVFTDEKWKKMYYLSNGNGSEMRKLSPLMW